MSKHTAKITTKSIEQSGLPADYKKAIAEYIWNGFDAGASEIRLNFKANEIGYLYAFSITDNGSGIDVNTIDETFGHFLDSHKAISFNKDGFVKGKKGKGRYAFSTFANQCNWQTTFKAQNNAFFQYQISIVKGDLQHFSLTDPFAVSKPKSTGTTVTFNDFFGLTGDLLLSRDFVHFLASEFGWFLFLNRDSKYQIFINDVALPYTEMIGDAEEIQYQIGEETFKVVFLRWNQRIGDKYYYYFLNTDRTETARKHTSFNNKAIDFHHSVYIHSNFFDGFQETSDDNEVLSFAGKNQADPAFKSLLKTLNTLVTTKEKQFIRDTQADKLITDYKEKGIFPVFKNTPDEQRRSTDLVKVMKELYCTEPRLFQGLTITQGKAFVGFLNLLLQTSQRENALDIMEGLVSLSDEERLSLSKVLAAN